MTYLMRYVEKMGNDRLYKNNVFINLLDTFVPNLLKAFSNMSSDPIFMKLCTNVRIPYSYSFKGMNEVDGIYIPTRPHSNTA